MIILTNSFLLRIINNLTSRRRHNTRRTQQNINKGTHSIRSSIILLHPRTRRQVIILSRRTINRNTIRQPTLINSRNRQMSITMLNTLPTRNIKQSTRRLNTTTIIQPFSSSQMLTKLLSLRTRLLNIRHPKSPQVQQSPLLLHLSNNKDNRDSNSHSHNNRHLTNSKRQNLLIKLKHNSAAQFRNRTHRQPAHLHSTLDTQHPTETTHSPTADT